MNLEAKRVVITGASSGIGFATARRFAEAGADLALIARGRDGLARAGELARTMGVAAYELEADIADRPALEGAIEEAARRLGGIDVVVANAGVGVYGRFDEISPDDFDRTIDVTFRGNVDTVRAALPHLKASRGTVIATVSMVSRVPTPLQSPYTAAKFALRGFLSSLRVEQREQRTGVEVCMVHPGPVDTPFWPNMTSANGDLPPTPPGAYRADDVAQAIVACAERPRPELTVGGSAAVQTFAYSVARPVAEGVLYALARAWKAVESPSDGRGALWEPTGSGDESGGAGGRPSLLTPIRARLPGLRL